MLLKKGKGNIIELVPFPWYFYKFNVIIPLDFHKTIV